MLELMATVGLLQRERDFGSEVEWAGKVLPCSAGALNTEKKLEAGGFAIGADVIIVIRTALLQGVARPAERQRCRYRTTPTSPWHTLYIESLTHPPGDVFSQLHCVRVG